MFWKLSLLGSTLYFLLGFLLPPFPMQPTKNSSAFAENKYTMCKHCFHFYDEDFGHLEDGEQEFDHDPESTGVYLTHKEWKALIPDLFKEYPDGKIGPNSIHFSKRGKL